MAKVERKGGLAEETLRDFFREMLLIRRFEEKVVERGNLGANAVVGGGLPATVGAALAFKFRGEERVAVAFFGDGATNIGTFHEALNLAQLWQVPAVFVCEDNSWAESTPKKQHSPIDDLSKRAEAYGMTAVKVDGQDV